MIRNVKTGQSLGDDFHKSAQEMHAFLTIELPEFVEMELQDQVDSSFEEEQFQDGKSSKWDKRKNDKDDTFKRSGKLRARNDRRGILIGKGTGTLHKEVKAQKSGMDVSVGTDIVYAQIHNEGLEGKAFGKYVFKMPQRQFMPVPGEENPVVEKKVDKRIDEKLDKIFG